MVFKYAQTETQEEEIEDLLTYFYKNIFPRYFTKDRISELERFGILRLQYNELTRDRACSILSALDIIRSIVELDDPEEQAGYKAMYRHNVQLLEQNGLSFPFPFELFTSRAVFKGRKMSQENAYVM